VAPDCRAEGSCAGGDEMGRTTARDAEDDDARWDAEMGRTICSKLYLLSSDDSTRFTLNHLVFCASKEKTSWCKSTGFIKVLHDGSNLLRLVLQQEEGNMNMRTQG
jgi:hypothetical protein